MNTVNGVAILQQVNFMELPSMSPDHLPIELNWDELNRPVRARLDQPANHVQLQAALLQEWNSPPFPSALFVRTLGP